MDVVSAIGGDVRRTSRSRFVREAGAAALGLTALGRLAAPARGAAAPQIVVVGAGLAGLCAAYSLERAGYTAAIHEASDRIGGRCWTIRGAFADGQIAEDGGELIDQSHGEIRKLAQDLGLKLDNLLQAEQNGTEVMGRFDGAPYSYAERTDDIKAAWQKIHGDRSAASYPTTFEVSTERGRELDRMSIVDWIEEKGRARDPVLDPALVRRPLEGRVRAAEAGRDSRAGHGHELEAARPVREPVLERARLERRDLLRHRLPEHVGRDARAAGEERHPRRLHRRQDRRELRLGHAPVAGETVPRAARAGLAGATKAWNGRATLDYWPGDRWTKGS